MDEKHITDAHSQVYGSDDGANVPASTLGSAAALQTLKSFMSSGGNTGNNSGGDFQTKMIGLAMSEAAKRFESSGNQGDKQDAVSGAAATMMKLLVQSKLSGGSNSGGAAGELTSLMGGSNSGGLGSLLSMVCLLVIEKTAYLTCSSGVSIHQVDGRACRKSVKEILPLVRVVQTLVRPDQGIENISQCRSMAVFVMRSLRRKAMPAFVIHANSTINAATRGRPLRTTKSISVTPSRQ